MIQLQPGDLLDNFRIEEQLHTSAVASLYRASDLVFEDTVVLKIPLDDIVNNPVLLYHFQNERKISKLLAQHPCIVRFLERDISHQYLVMEYIEGSELRSLLARHPRFGIDKTVRICSRIAEGLAYLHNNSILHLDLKPENIMVTPQGQPIIIDFGVSRNLAIPDTLGNDFTGPKGTPYYIAPEQLCSIRNDNRSDIYSLGIIIYEMLTGKLPFTRSKELARVRERLKIDPVPLRYYDQQIPASLQDIVLRSLSRDPDKRQQTAAALATELKNYRSMPAGKFGDLLTKPLALLSHFNLSRDATLCPDSQPEEDHQGVARHFLGCITDHENSDAVIEYVRRECILHGGTITLLHVIESTGSAEFEQYAQEMEGAQFSHRLDTYISTLNRYGLYPELRIKRGNAADTIIDTAAQLHPDHIVIGRPRSRTFLAKVFFGSVIEKIVDAGLTNVIVAQPERAAEYPSIDSSMPLPEHQLYRVQLYLFDCWVQHLNMLTDLTNALLASDQPAHLDIDHSCSLTGWLDDMTKHNSQLATMFTQFRQCHTEFHSALQSMVQHSGNNNPRAMRNIYRYRALPLIGTMKQELHSVISRLRPAPPGRGGHF